MRLPKDVGHIFLARRFSVAEREQLRSSEKGVIRSRKVRPSICMNLDRRGEREVSQQHTATVTRANLHKFLPTGLRL